MMAQHLDNMHVCKESPHKFNPRNPVSGLRRTPPEVCLVSVKGNQLHFCHGKLFGKLLLLRQLLFIQDYFIDAMLTITKVLVLFHGMH
jgi:hypothetical protein